MATTTITFHVPQEIARGLASGRYQLFGGVVRNNAGRLVKMLDPVSRSASRFAKGNPKLAAVALAVVIAASGAILVSNRLSKRARLGRRLAAIDAAFKSVVRNRPSLELTRDDLRELKTSIEDFLQLTNSPAYREVKLAVHESERQILLEFADALRSFSAKLVSASPQQEPVPELPPATSPELVPIVDAIWRQLDYQQRHWPSQVTRRVAEAIKQQRPYASYWEWPAKPVKEAGVMRDFLEAWENASFPLYASVESVTPDPPDFVATTSTGAMVGIELTELVSEDTIRANAQASRAGVSRRYYRDWQPDEVLTAIQARLDDKGSKTFHGGPYQELHVVIHVDEPTLRAGEYRSRLRAVTFTRPAQLSRAFLLFSYDPDEEGCSLIELRL